MKNTNKMSIEFDGKTYYLTQEEYDKNQSNIQEYLIEREAERNRRIRTSKRTIEEFVDSLIERGFDAEGTIRSINKNIRAGKMNLIPADIAECENPLKFIMQAYTYLVHEREVK